MKIKLFSSILLLSFLHCSGETVFSYSIGNSSVVLQDTDALGLTFQNEVTQDQADINRVAVGGRFLTDFFEPFLQLNRAFDAFKKSSAHVLSRTEYFDLESAEADDIKWIEKLRALSENGPNSTQFRDAVRAMYKYMDRTLDDTTRGYIAKKLWETLKAEKENYTGPVEAYLRTEEGLWDSNVDGSITKEFDEGSQFIYAIEKLLGCQQVKVDGEKTIIKVMKGELATTLEELQAELQNIAKGTTPIIWKTEEPVFDPAPEEQEPSIDSELPITVATEAMQKGILLEISRLSDEVGMLAMLANRIDSRGLLNLFNENGVPEGINESLITMMQKNHSEFENSLKNFISTFLNRIEKTVDYIVPLVEQISRFTR